MHEAELRVPMSWQDQSMQLFRVPSDSDGSDASFIVTRDYDGVATPATTYADGQVAVLKQKFRGFKLLTKREITIDGVASVVIDYEWESNNIVLRQRQAYFPAIESMLTLTLTARTVQFDALESAWQTVLASFRLNKDPVRQNLSR